VDSNSFNHPVVKGKALWSFHYLAGSTDEDEHPMYIMAAFHPHTEKQINIQSWYYVQCVITHRTSFIWWNPGEKFYCMKIASSWSSVVYSCPILV